MNPCGDTIGWADQTWNPVTGCRHGCPYCYARRIAARFGKTPGQRAFRYQFHRLRLREPERFRTPSRIFVVSMGDLFGRWVPWSVIARVMAAEEAAPQHTYLHLTKDPGGMSYHVHPGSTCWWGVTATAQHELEARLSCLPAGVKRWVSFEPLLGPVRLGKIRPDYVVIGAQTGPGAKDVPPEWVTDLALDCALARIPIFVKDNAPWVAPVDRPRDLVPLP